MRTYTKKVRPPALYKVTPIGKFAYAVTGPNCRRVFSGPGARKAANDLALERNAKAIKTNGATQSMNPPLCVNCKNCVIDPRSPAPNKAAMYAFARCRIARRPNYVNDEPIFEFCSEERTKGQCGPHGKHFVPAVTTEAA